MNTRLSPETAELMARVRDSAREVPFDADALLADIEAQVATNPASGAAKHRVSPSRPAVHGLGSKVSLLKVGLATIGAGGLFFALRTTEPPPRAAPVAAARSVVAATPRISQPPRVTPPPTTNVAPSPTAQPPAPPVALPVAETTPLAPRRAPHAASARHAAPSVPPAAAPVATPAATSAATPTAAPAAPTAPSAPHAEPMPDPFALEVAMLQRAEREIHQGRARDALSTLTDLLELRPSSQLIPEAMAAQVRVHCILLDESAALSVARRLVARAPRSVAARQVLASCVGGRLSAAQP